MSSDEHTDEIDRKEVLKSVLSIEFVTWLAAFVPAFVALTLLLGSLDLPTWVVLAAGMLFGEIADRAVDWFTERYHRRVRGVTEDAE